MDELETAKHRSAIVVGGKRSETKRTIDHSRIISLLCTKSICEARQCDESEKQHK